MASRTAPRATARPAAKYKINYITVFLWVLVFAGVFAAFRSAANRYNTERDNRRVEIALDYVELRTLAATQGVPISDILQQFKAAGATSVAIQEETVAGLDESKRITVATDPTPQTLIRDAEGQDRLIKRIEEAIQAKSHFQESNAVGAPGTGLLMIKEPWGNIRSIGVGLDEDTVATVNASGLGIVGRVSNWTGVTPTGLTWTLAELKKQGVSTVLFSGDEVLGYKGYVSEDRKNPQEVSTSATLKNLDLFYGAIEFGKQKGDPELSKAAAENTVRVHTIPGSELVSMTPPEAVQRFALAARERNIRLIFVRLFLDEVDPVKFNTDYVAKIVKALKRGNLETGKAHGYGDLTAPAKYRLFIGIGVGAALLLLLDAITGVLSGGLGVLGVVASLLVSLGIAGLAAAPIALGPKVAALAAAIIFPSLALLRNDLLGKNAGGGAMARFLSTCFITALGIVCVVGLLADRLFLIKADAFAGIKAALSLPVLLVALVYVLDLRATKGRTFRKSIEEAIEKIVELSKQPLLIWQIGAGLVVLILLVLLLARSGNDSAVAVSGIELKIRSLLDRFLYARPRFKDMFGHGALLLSFLVLQRTGRREWALPLFLVGAIGQVSFLNTFCHLHTPLPVSLWRAGIGLAFGAIGGVIAYFLVERLIIRRIPKEIIEAGQ